MEGIISRAALDHSFVENIGMRMHLWELTKTQRTEYFSLDKTLASQKYITNLLLCLHPLWAPENKEK